MTPQSHARAADVLANERTFLAYLRTALSFIAFGFVIARFALFTREIAGITHAHAAPPAFSNAFGTAVAIFGTAIAAFGGYRYIATDRALQADRTASMATAPAIVLSAVVAVIGIAVTIVLIVVK